jgi:tetratricopeptide (TPR) repeat protein
MGPGVQRGQDTTLVRDALDASVANIGRGVNASPQSSAELYGLVGNAYLGIGEVARAEALHRRALAYFQSVTGSESTRLRLLDLLADESVGLGRHEEAEAFQRDALSISRTLDGRKSLQAARAENRLAILLLRLLQISPESHPSPRSAEAETLLRQSLATRRQLLGPRDAVTEESRSNLMDALQRQGKAQEADALYEELLRQSQGNPFEQAAILHARGRLRGYGNRWSEAAGDLAHALQLNPKDDKIAFDLAIALLKSERIDDYRRHCHAFLERATTGTELPTADKAAKVSLLLPVDAADGERASELADRVASFAATSPSDPVTPWFNLCKALAELRRGRFESAIDWANRVTATRQAVRETRAAALFIAASAHARLRHSDSSREALARGEALINQTTRNVITESERDWLVADVLRRQAVHAEQSLSPAVPTPAADARPSPSRRR